MTHEKLITITWFLTLYITYLKKKTRFSVLLWANSEPPNIIQMIKFPWKTPILTAIKIIKTSLQILKGNLDLY